MSENTTMATDHQGWVILEILGHRRLAGFLTEQEIAGVSFLRIDIPQSEPDGLSEVERRWMTQFYAPSAVYAITPTTEDVAREIAAQAPQPLGVWDVRALLPDIKEEVKREIENDVAEAYRAELRERQKRIQTQTYHEPDEDDADYAADGPAF